jgi:hypothetical protein
MNSDGMQEYGIYVGCKREQTANNVKTMAEAQTT